MAVTVIEHITITANGVEWTYTDEDGRSYKPVTINATPEKIKITNFQPETTTPEAARIAAKRALREFH